MEGPNNSDDVILENPFNSIPSISWRPVTWIEVSIESAKVLRVTPSRTNDSNSIKSSCNKANASASTSSFNSSWDISAFVLIWGSITSVNFKICNESSSSIIELIELSCIDDIAISNSSGNASPDEKPKSPIASFEARSSLNLDTASSNEISFDWILSYKELISS